MKNFVKTMLFLFVLGTTFGVSAEPATKSFESANGFTVQYSTELRRLEQKAELALVHTGGGKEAINPVMVLTSQMVKPGQSAKQVFEKTANRMQTKHRATNFKASAPTRVNGTTFYSGTFNRKTPKGNSTSCRTYSYYNSKTGLNVFVLAVAPAGNSQKYLNDFHAVVKSFRLK